MKTPRHLFNGITLVVILMAAAGSGQAQAPEPASGDAPEAPVGNGFTYQGYLADGGNPASGAYDFRFTLFNAPSGGSQVGSILSLNGVAVTEGLFTTPLDFGSVFDGTRMWLEVAVRPAGGAGHTVLGPRQEIMAAPYALYAMRVARVDHLSAPDGAPADALVVDNSGNVGIGVPAPAVKLDVNGHIRSTSYSIVAASPYALSSWSSVTVLPSDQGYAYLRSSATGLQQAYLSPTLPAIVFGVRQKLLGITVCYQLDDADSYITRTEAFYNNASGERVVMFEDDTDRQRTTFGCYDYVDPTPDAIVGTVVLQFWLNYAGTGWAHDIAIGRVALWLTEN